MIVATVIGPIWATKRVEGLPSGALLELEEVATGSRLVALDQLGSGEGDTVLVTCGSGVSKHFPGKAPLDAFVVGVIDESTFQKRQLNNKSSSNQSKGQIK